MNKKDLINEIYYKYGFKKKDIKEIVEATFDTIIDLLADGQKISINNFGTFSVEDYKSRSVIMPTSHEIIKIQQHKIPKFKAGKRLKESVLNNDL